MVRLRPDNGTEWTTQDWVTTSDSWDTAFFADFSSGTQTAVPDPPRSSLFLIGLAFVAFEGIRRKYARRILKRVR